MISEADIIEVKISEEMMRISTERAHLKESWIDTWKNRSNSTRFQNFLDGQLGEEAVKHFLTYNKIPFDYYDDIRKDGFKEKDLYDFMLITANGEKLELSVKSSKLKKDIARTISENNIIAYPGQVKPFTIQPFIDIENNRIILTGWIEGVKLEATIPKSLPGDFSDKKTLTHQIKIQASNPLLKLSEVLGY